MKPVRSNLVVPAGFWAGFVRSYWRKRPVRLKSPFIGSLTTPAEIFDGFVRASDSFRDNRTASQAELRVYIDNLMMLTDLDDYLPRRSDGSLIGFTHRMNLRLRGRQWGVILNDFQQWHWQTWFTTRDFLRGLHDVTGVSAGDATTNIFFGNYDSTPFGIHKDHRSVFTWVLSGKKRILVWPFKVFEGHKGISRADVDASKALLTQSVPDFRDQAQALEGEAGDVLFWPDSYWHTAESVKGAPSPVTMTLGINTVAKPASRVRTALADAIGKADSRNPPKNTPGDPCQPGNHAQRLPRPLTLELAALRNVVRSGGVELRLGKDWLNFLTSLGLQSAPAPLPTAKRLTDRETICADSRYPAVWGDFGERMVISTNGHSLMLDSCPEVATLLTLLNKGSRVKVGDILSRFAGVERKDLLDLLLALETFRWLSRDI